MIIQVFNSKKVSSYGIIVVFSLNYLYFPSILCAFLKRGVFWNIESWNEDVILKIFLELRLAEKDLDLSINFAID